MVAEETTDNQSLETDTSMLDEHTDTTESEVPEEVLEAIEGFQNEENEVLDSHLDDEPEEEPDDEPVGEVEEETEEVEDSGREAAMEHLLEKGIAAETLDAIDDNTLLAIAKSHGFGEAEADPTEEVDEATEEVEAATKEPIDAASVIEAISKDLGSEFDASETAAIGKAITRAIGMGGDGGDYGKQIQAQNKTINDLVGFYEGMIIDAEMPKLAEIYPDIDRERLVARAKKLSASGVKVATPQELLRSAAVLEFGEGAVNTHKKFNNKKSRAKSSGQPTGKTGGKDTVNHGEDAGLSLVREFMKDNT